LELHSYFIWGRVGYATNGVGVVEKLGGRRLGVVMLKRLGG
jgi:hypothetical protein